MKCIKLTTLLLIVAYFCTAHAVFAAKTTQITKNGIRWDYWVVGPVTIIQIEPEYDGSHNGWEVNPISNLEQGFDDGCDYFKPTLIPTLPYKASPGESIVKSISSGNPRPCLKKAAVLTVVSSPLPDNGATVFRPPYVGKEKPYYSTKDVHYEYLPSLKPVSPRPSLEWIIKRFGPVQLDHGQRAMGRFIHPKDHMPNYAPDMAKDNSDAALRLMLNDAIDNKKKALYVYLQYGIDLYHMVLNGQRWPAGGGYTPGKKLPFAFTAAMLDHEDMKEWLQNHVGFFNEDSATYYNSDGVALFGFDPAVGGSKTRKDPYEYIDGGPEPGGAYQFCCLSQPWKGTALAAHLMPEIKALWGDPDFFEYVDRWVNFGVWSLPDPHNRYPNLHGTKADGGHRRSRFADAMWKAYRKSK